MSKTTTLTITIEEKEKEITIREPLAMDLIQLDDGLNQNARMMRLIEITSDHAPNELIGMKGSDFFACSAAVNVFLESAGQT